MDSKELNNQDEVQASNGTPGRTLDYYLDLPYTLELWRAPEGGWVTQVKELPGCVSQGETAEEALEMIQDAMAGWLEVALEIGKAIPEPRHEEDYSGKFVVRVPRSLHRDLVTAAAREGVSLNQYINTVLAQAVGHGSAAPGPGWPSTADLLDPLVHRLEKLVQQFASSAHLPALLALHEGEGSYETHAAQQSGTAEEAPRSEPEAAGDTT